MGDQVDSKTRTLEKPKGPAPAGIAAKQRKGRRTRTHLSAWRVQYPLKKEVRSQLGRLLEERGG